MKEMIQRLIDAQSDLLVQEVKRSERGKHEVVFTEPVDMTGIATVCLMPKHLAHLRAEAVLREGDDDYLVVECVQIHITDRATGDFVDCTYDPCGVDGYRVIFGPAPQFTQILTQ